jgi:hypothetical protein
MMKCLKNEKRKHNNVYEIIAAYRQATLHILSVLRNPKHQKKEHKRNQKPQKSVYFRNK